MGKFKVGDRVRVIDNSGAPSRYVNGEIGLVEEVYAGNMVRLAGKSAGMYGHRFEAWQPKVGDRVTANDTTRVNIEEHWNEHFRRSVGDIVDDALVVASISGATGSNVGLSNKAGRAYFFMPASTLKPAESVAVEKQPEKPELTEADGFKIGDRVKANAGFTFDPSIGKIIGIAHHKAVLIEVDGQLGSIWCYPTSSLSPTPLTIEAGKFYKTRDGRKVGPISRDSQGRRGHWYWQAPYLEGYSANWCENGSFYKSDENRNDLIAEWIDEQPAKASNDNAEPAKPTFKVGDRVKTKGWARFYEIAEVEGTDIHVILYDGTTSKEYTEGREFEFELTTPAIVALIENGTAKPATRPKVHADKASATTEAERLALQFPGQQFGVFVLADSKIADVVT
jgi:hypothetical protein